MVGNSGTASETNTSNAGKAGATNAGLLATQILAAQYPQYLQAIEDFRQHQTDKVLANPTPGVQA